VSSAAVIPPPNSSSLLRRVPRLTAQARALLTAMNLHFAGVAALGVLVLYLIAHLIFVGQALNSRNQDALDEQRIELKAAEVAAKPLRGLDLKLVDSTKAADKFYAQRLPYAFSQVLAELGVLTKKENVRLVRAQYSQNPVLSGDNQLNEVHMDASISGDYRPVVLFVNAIERDKMFVVITGINLTGQQTGQVNLRIRMTTYLRAPHGDELNLALPSLDTTVDAANASGATR